MPYQPWQNCQYFYTDDCPNLAAISKVMLIPQLLDLSEIKAIKELCENCERRRSEKRRSRRINRPLRVSVVSLESTRNAQGSTVNLSSTGALVQLDTRIDFKTCERVKIQSYSDDSVSSYNQEDSDDGESTVKRVSKDKGQIAVMFIDKDTADKITDY